MTNYFAFGSVYKHWNNRAIFIPIDEICKSPLKEIVKFMKEVGQVRKDQTIVYTPLISERHMIVHDESKLKQPLTEEDRSHLQLLTKWLESKSHFHEDRHKFGWISRSHWVYMKERNCKALIDFFENQLPFEDKLIEYIILTEKNPDENIPFTRRFYWKGDGEKIQKILNQKGLNIITMIKANQSAGYGFVTSSNEEIFKKIPRETEWGTIIVES